MSYNAFAHGRFALLTDHGEMLGLARMFRGGLIRGEVATRRSGRSFNQRKHLASICYEDAELDIGLGMSPWMYEWIRAAFDIAHVRKSGEIHACDFDGNSMSIREFHDAQITEVTIPICDVSNEEPAYMTVKLKPEEIIYKPGTGSQLVSEINPAGKKWLGSNFRLELGELPCSRVTRIDSFTWKLGVAREKVGMFRVPSLFSGWLGRTSPVTEVPNIKITISLEDVKPWEDWHHSFLVKCGGFHSGELNGSITYLAPDRKEELAKLHLINAGIVALDNFPSQRIPRGKEEVACFEVELYVEQMKFEYLVKDA